MVSSVETTAILSALAFISASLAVAVAAHPAIVRGQRGKVVALLAFILLPVLITAAGTREHLERSKSIGFCLSCHVMEPYGQSLVLADTDYVPAVHFQNHLIDAEHACYTCHSSYTMYGDLEAKMRGLRHVWIHYFGSPQEPIELYEEYNNRECLFCHAGARRFEENEFHADERSALAANETSCMECHDLIHDVGNLEGLDVWQGVALGD